MVTTPGPVDPSVEEAFAIEGLQASRAELRDRARVAIGVTGEDEAPPLRQAIARSGVGWYPLFALGLLVVVDEFQGYVLGVLAPEITASLGISTGQLGLVVLVRTAVVTLAVLPLAALVQHRPRRALLSVLAAILWSLMTIGAAYVVNVWGLLAVMIAAGVCTGTVAVVHTPLLVDTYPPDARLRSLSFYRAANAVGSIIGPLLVGLAVTVLDYTWRGALFGLGLCSLAAAFVAIGLRDPGFGKWDTEKVRDTVRESMPRESTDPKPVQLGFWEVCRRLFLIPTLRGALIASAVVGAFLVPLYTFLSFFLRDRWGMGPGARSIFFAIMPVFAIVLLYIFGKRGERLFREDPGKLVSLTGVTIALAGVLVAAAIAAPVFVLMVALFGIALGLIACLTPALSLVMLSIIPSYMRPHISALAGVMLAAGAGGGMLLLSGLQSRFGTGIALSTLCIPGVIAGLIMRHQARTINDDLNAMLDEIIEEEELRTFKAQGGRLPMLACRHVDVSYGQVQVLFDVDFSVDEGEIVALLGTNGAGKSTLLRAISGLVLPSRGTVRYQGNAITYVDPERRAGLGFSLIAGGRGVFPPLDVVENLRLFGYKHGRSRKTVEEKIEACFAAFPQLANRRNQQASTLSGGEQQMLAVSKALMVPPKLLLIDELSLGLAPVIVSELLATVRRINAEGTAVVLVEQSVNVSLSVVEHAYFMEKGQIRFDGAAQELLARPDLLRSVFLEGAGDAWSAARGAP